MCRPPVALERLEELPDGRLLYHLKRRWRDGTDSVVFEPLEFLERQQGVRSTPTIWFREPSHYALIVGLNTCYRPHSDRTLFPN